MALIGPTLAIASVGIACQTAHQIERHQRLIAELMDDPHMEKHATPFDWLLCPVSAAVKMIRAEEYHPLNMGELDPKNRAYEALAGRLGFSGENAELVKLVAAAGGWHKPFWPRMGCHFWHDKFDDPRQFLEKHRHTADNLKRFCIAQRRVFVVSNTQNNVNSALVAAGRNPIETRFRWGELLNLYEALAAQWWPCELAVLTRRDLIDGQPDGAPGTLYGRPVVDTIRLFYIEADRSQFAGDDKQWENVFRTLFGKKK